MTARNDLPRGWAARLPGLANLLAVAGLIAGVGLTALSLPRTRDNSLTLAASGRSIRPVTWLWLDAVAWNNGGQPASLNGYLWNEPGGDHVFQVASDGGLEIRLNGETVYQREQKGEAAVETFHVALPAGASAIAVNYLPANPIEPRYEVSLSEHGRLIAPWRLFPAPPAAEAVARQRWAWAGLACGLALLAGSAILVAALAVRSLPVGRRDLLWSAAITVAAIAFRIGVALERYQTTPDIYAMERVWDNFVGLGRSLLAGRIALAGNYYQQGAIVYAALSQAALGPGLLPQYLLNAVLGGLACGLVVAGGWALFGRTEGLLAGGLMALYAPLAHYQTTLQIDAPATFAAAASLALAAWLVRRPGWRPALAFGAAVGLGVITRGTLLALAAGGPAALLLSPAALAPRRRWLLSGVALASLGLTLLPLTIANARVGVLSLSSGGQAIAFFRGNHRDTFGINEYQTDREQLARLRAGSEANFGGETWRDIRADPGHWLQQLAHKAGLFWSGHEYADQQLDFYTTGLQGSSLLRLAWLGGLFNLTALAALAGLGAALGWLAPARRPGIALLGLLALLGMAFTVVFSVTGRVRAPFLPLLFPLVALGLAGLAGAVRSRAMWRRLALAISAAAAALVLMRALETQLPRPTVVARLPASLVPTGAVFDSKVRLIGFDALDSNYRPGGYLEVALYWEALAPLSQDYTMFIHLLDPSLQRVGGLDRMLGGANLPPYPPTQWQTGQIVRQIYFVPLPQADTLPVPLQVVAGLYGPDGARLPISAAEVDTLGGTAAVLTGLSLMPPAPVPPPPLARPLEIRAADQIALIATSLPADDALASGDEAIELQINWEALAHPARAYTLFLHLVDDSGGLAAQYDGPPVAGFATDAWPPGSRWSGRYAIALPAGLPPGGYRLYAGLYELRTLERLELIGEAGQVLPDDQALLATVTLAP